MEGLEIRSIRDSDENTVAALWREVFPNNPWWNVPERDIQSKLQIQRELFLVATVDSTIVGTAMAGYDGHRGWVYYVAVSPKYRRQGIGEALMKRVEQDLIEIGCPKINLQVRAHNAGAVAFYEKLGYSVENHVSMGKLLRDED